MKFAKIAWKDISSIFKNRFIRVSVVAIIIVPLLYSLLYLAAFWDPYARLEKLPVAFVNLDKGSTKDGEAVNYGQDILENLKDNKEVKWQFVSLDEAKNGLEKDGYYSMFVIPEDFSSKIVSAKDGKPQQPNIIYSANEKKNFLAAQIGGRVEDKLKAEIIKNISEEYTKVTFDSLYELKDGMRKAADGSKELSDGINTLSDKVPEMADGVGKLYDGSSKLNDGLGKLKGNSPKMADGVNKLYDGSSQLKDGIAYLNNNSNSMGAGVNQLYDGANKLSEGINSTAVGPDGKPAGLTNGLKALSQGLNGAKTGVDDLGNSLAALNGAVNVGSGNSPSLVQGVTGINNGVSQLSSVLGTFNKVVNKGAVPTPNGMSQEQIIAALVQQYNSAPNDTVRAQVLSQMIGVLNSAVNVDKSATEPSLKSATNALTNSVTVDSPEKTSLKSAVAALNAAVNTGYNGKPSLKSGMEAATVASNSLVKGTEQLGQGATQLKGGLAQFKEKMPQLAEGTGKLTNGAVALNGGLAELKGNMPELVSGVNQLADGSVQLKDGLSKLNDNMPELKDGAGKLKDGSKELADKLSEGADKLDKNLVNSSEDMAAFVSGPITLTNEAVNAVKDYGTGFTPYFIPLSLWVGAIMMFFVISAKVEDSMNAGPISTVFGKYLSYGFIGMLQAVLVSVVVLALGLKPQNLPLYFLFNILMSLAFIAIIQCLIFVLGDAGRLLAIVLLILQLTSCAGTFPLELVPDLFKFLNPFMPFTYCVSALREIISGTNLALIGHDMFILTAILFVFLAISMILKERGDLLQARMEEKKEITA